MQPCARNESARIRLLGLGNEILADDAFGILVAREVERLIPRQVEVVCSSAAGFNLMDDMLGASRLIVVDTIVTGSARPGTIHVFRADQIPKAPGVAPHFLGLFEVLAVGRQLHLDLPEEITVVAVEASDCATIGGVMHPEVRSAVNTVVNLVRQFVAVRPQRSTGVSTNVSR
jgi:hydrogenase maturation protease